jgi:hypothetical protein
MVERWFSDSVAHTKHGLSLSPLRLDPRGRDSHNEERCTLSLYVIIFKHAAHGGKIIEVLNMLEETPAWKELDALVRAVFGEPESR